MTIKDIPYEFISHRVPISWTEVKFGLDNQLIKSKAAISKAMDQLCNTDQVPKEVRELAIRADNEPVIDLVSYLTTTEASSFSETVKEKWLYIVLAWLFENRKSVIDPLKIVEEVYSDFDYPQQISSFVRYMPAIEPSLGSREQNEARMVDRWKAYLDKEQERFEKQS